MYETLACVSVAVRDLDRAIETYQRLGFQVKSEVQHSERGFGLTWINMGNQGGSLLELLAPSGPGPVQRFLDEHGEGIYQVRFGVDDLDLTVAQLEDRKVSVIHDPSPGTGSTTLAWIHPRETHGVLFELLALGHSS